MSTAYIIGAITDLLFELFQSTVLWRVCPPCCLLASLADRSILHNLSPRSLRQEIRTVTDFYSRHVVPAFLLSLSSHHHPQHLQHIFIIVFFVFTATNLISVSFSDVLSRDTYSKALYCYADVMRLSGLSVTPRH